MRRAYRQNRAFVNANTERAYEKRIQNIRASEWKGMMIRMMHAYYGTQQQQDLGG